MTSTPRSRKSTRIAINLLTDDPNNPSGAHWFWTRVIPEMSPADGHARGTALGGEPEVQADAPGVRGERLLHHVPVVNERRKLRTLSEHLYSPLRLPISGIDVFSTLMAPIINPTWSTVVHIKTMHAFTEPESVAPLTRAYRLASYPRTVQVAEAIIINSESLRTEIERHLEVDSASSDSSPRQSITTCSGPATRPRRVPRSG